MSKKTEIKVYLPGYLVGRLEEKKRAGVRSKFIEQAIHRRLDGESGFDIWDLEDKEIFDETVSRLRRLNREDAIGFTVQLAEILRRVYQ